MQQARAQHKTRLQLAPPAGNSPNVVLEGAGEHMQHSLNELFVAGWVPELQAYARPSRQYLRLGNDVGAQAVVTNSTGNGQDAHDTHTIPVQDLASQGLDAGLHSRPHI